MIICPWGFFELTETSDLEPYFSSKRWIIHAFIWNSFEESRALCIKLAQLKRELHIGKQQVPVFWCFVFFPWGSVELQLGLKKTAIFGSGRVRFTVTRDLQRFAIVGRHWKNMEKFVRHQFVLGSSNISWAAKGGICTSSLYQCVPGTLNNHF